MALRFSRTAKNTAADPIDTKCVSSPCLYCCCCSGHMGLQASRTCRTSYAEPTEPLRFGFLF
jgi:hypothetical protein